MNNKFKKITKEIKKDEWVSYLTYENTKVEGSDQEANNKISVASKLGVWVKNHFDEDGFLAHQKELLDKKIALRESGLPFDPKHSNKSILSHQLDRDGIVTEEIGDYKFYFIPSFWSPHYGTVKINNSIGVSVDVDESRSSVIVGVGYNPKTWESQKDKTVKFILSSLVGETNKVEEDYLENKKSYGNKTILMDCLHMVVKEIK